MITLLDGLIDGRYRSLLSLVLDTLTFLRVEKFLLFLRQSTHSFPGPVGEGRCIGGAIDTALGRCDLSNLVSVIVPTQTTLRTISQQVLVFNLGVLAIVQSHANCWGLQDDTVVRRPAETLQ